MSDMITNPENVTSSAVHRDAITANASPRPWRVRMELRDTYERRGTFAHVEDANGETICTTITPRCDADAALIVEAVNERDRLRDELYTTRLELAHAVHSDEQAGKACHKWAEEYRALGKEYRALRDERDCLRDLVRRLANMAETTIPDAMENWDGFTSGRVEFEREAYALIREARAAIGEDSANG